MSPRPVLILGTGRCGSTLLSRALRAHPAALSVSELISFVTDLGMRIPRAFPEGVIPAAVFWDILATPQPRQGLLLRHGLQMDEVIYPWDHGRYTPETGLPPILQALVPHLDPTDPDTLFDAMGAFVQTLPPARLGDHYRALFGWLMARMGRRTWVERSGGSLRVAARMLQLFPEAQVIHLVRDGRDTALSMSQHIGFRMAMIAGQQVDFLGVDPFESDDRGEEADLSAELHALLPERFSAAAFDAFDLPVSLCGHYWSGEIVAGLRALSALPPDRLWTLRYEDLLADPRGSFAVLDGILDPEGAQPGWVEASAALVGRGRSRWRELPERQRAELDLACRPGHDALDAFLAVRGEARQAA